MKTLTFWIECNPATGDIKPYEIFVKGDDGIAQKCSSSKTLKAAEKSIKERMNDRKDFYICTYQKQDKEIPLTEKEYLDIERAMQWPEDLEAYDKSNRVINGSELGLHI
jgi:hypothetical protein